MPSINQKYRSAVAGMALVLASPMVLAKSTIKKSTEKQQIRVIRELKTEMSVLHDKAVQGDAESQYQLAVALRKGDLQFSNSDVAARWFLKAAGQGHEGAITFIILFSSNTLTGLPSESYSVDTISKIHEFSNGYNAACKKYIRNIQ